MPCSLPLAGVNGRRMLAEDSLRSLFGKGGSYTDWKVRLGRLRSAPAVEQPAWMAAM